MRGIPRVPRIDAMGNVYEGSTQGNGPTWVLCLVTFSVGLFTPSLGPLSFLLGFLILGTMIFVLLVHILERKQHLYTFPTLIGVLLGGQPFFRDFVMRGFPAGYLVVDYAVLGLGLLSLPIVVASRFPRAVRSPIWLWGTLCLWTIITLSISVDPARGRIFTVLYIDCFLLMLLATHFSRDPRWRSAMLDGVILGALLALGIAINYYVVTPEEFWRDPESVRFGHTLTSAVQVGTFLYIGTFACILRFLEHKRLLFSGVIVLVLSSFAFFTFSRGPLIALLAALLVLLSVVNRRSRLPVLFVIGLSGSVALSLANAFFPQQLEDRVTAVDPDRVGQGRLDIWSVSFDMWAERPLAGWGAGSYTPVYAEFSWRHPTAPQSISDAHNMLVQIAVELGVPGLFLFMASIAGLVTVAWRVKAVPALAALTYTIVLGVTANWKIPIVYALIAIACMYIVESLQEREDGAVAPIRSVPSKAHRFLRGGTF
mgnify:FL=1